MTKLFIDEAEQIITCFERGKEVTYVVRLMTYSPENIKRLWNKSKKHRILFHDDIHGDFQKFCSVFFSQDPDGHIYGHGLTWVVNDFLGVFYLNGITPREANVDFSFFDGRLRFQLTQAMIEYVFEEYGFDRLNAQIVPYANSRVFEFIKNLGFVYEGKKRKAHLYKGGKIDLILYGLLKEEFFETLEKQYGPKEKEDNSES